MLLKLSWYKFKLECYNFRILNVIPPPKNVIPMVTKKTIAKMKQEGKVNTSLQKIK